MNDRNNQHPFTAQFKLPARVVTVVALAFGTLFGIASCTSAPRDVRFAYIEDHRIAYRVFGAGQPVVVMISGLGDGMATFEDVATEIARSATVIIYDRAGYGGSDAVEGARDARAAERELSALLDRSGVSGPYVVLGHSVGGLYAEYYASEHAEEIAALILEDSRPADFRRACEAAGVSMCAAPAAMAWTMPAGARSELAALVQTEAQVEQIAPMIGKPVLVLSRPAPERASGFDAAWAIAQSELAARYAGARHLTAPSGGHYIHHDEAGWFVTSVQAFLESGDAER
jgi:pimeloyl-ACP methyl ester carboxylesterase